MPDQLAQLLRDNEDWLMERVLEHALRHGYTRYASLNREDWRSSVHGLSEALGRALAAGPEALEMGPDERFAGDPASAFAVEEAARHRVRGVSLSMFLGMLAYYRQSYLDLVEDRFPGDGARMRLTAILSRFFDRIGAAVAVDWNAAGETARLEALRQAALRTQHEKHRILSVLQTLPNPVLLTDREGRVTDLNQAAVAWLEQAGEAPRGGREAYLDEDAVALLPWIGPAMERLRMGARSPQQVLGRAPGPERVAFLDTHLHPLTDVNGAFDGLFVLLQDVSALRAANADQARVTSELREQLRAASSLNRMAGVLSKNDADVPVLLQELADALPSCWDSPERISALVRFDDATYRSAGGPTPDRCAQTMEEPVALLGLERGALRLCGTDANTPFSAGDAALLSAIARQAGSVLETRQSLELLGQSERQFRAFFDGAADAFFIHDETGRILDANKKAGIWLNLPTESLPGASLLNSLAEGEREAVAGRFQNALRGEPELFQATLIRRDGFTFPAEFLCQAQPYQGAPALFTSGRNVAARLGAQAEIERRLKTEALVSAISSRLINAPEEQMSQAVEDSLAELCEFLGMRRAGVYLLDARARGLVLASQRDDPAGGPLPEALRRLGRRKTPWFMERLLAGERVFVRDAGHMPPAARREKELLLQAGILSLAAVPMTAGDRLLGVLAVASAAPQDAARLTGSRVLDQVALLFANAIARLRSARALRRSEALARAIIDALPATICVLDRRGALTMVNRAWAASGPASTPTGQSRLDPGDNYLEACRAAQDSPVAQAALEGIQAVLAGRSRSFGAEYPVTGGGQTLWWMLQAVPLGGSQAGAVVSHRDITERRLAVERLRESEERFRIIVETAQEAVMNIDGQRRVTYLNPRALALFGFSAEELLGQSVLRIIDPLDHELLARKFGRRRLGHSDQYELRFRHKNGHRIWTMLSASPLLLSDGTFGGSVGMITDISDRVRAELRLRRNESRYRSLVESMHEGLLMARRGGMLSYVNERFCAMLGRKRSEFHGRKAEEFVDEASRDKLAALLAGVLAGTRVGGSEEILWQHAEGRHIYSLVSPSASLDEEGKPVGFFAVVTDLTERRGLESQLLQSQKLEAIGQLAAGIAHEINTPAQYVGNNVQFIKGAFDDVMRVVSALQELLARGAEETIGREDKESLSRLLAERDVDYLAEEVPGAISQTLEGVERISTIVRSVKQFAHPGAAVMAPADLNESMKSTATVSRNEWKYVAELDLDLDPSLPLVTCMIGEINQVVLNLIINAAHAVADAKKADPERPGRITLSTRLAPPWAEIRVVDSGTGIPAHVQPRIFDPFFTTKEVGRGTGQGLTISRGIVVEKHKGQLFFETTEGQGTTFVVRLPLNQEA